MGPHRGAFGGIGSRGWSGLGESEARGGDERYAEDSQASDYTTQTGLR